MNNIKCELIKSGESSGLTYKTNDLSKDTYLKCTNVPLYVKTILDTMKCGHDQLNGTSLWISDLKRGLINNKIIINQDIPPSEYFPEWEQYTQIINTIIDTASVHNTKGIKIVW